MDSKFCDFDNTRFRVSIAPEDLSVMTISLAMPCWDDLVSHGVKEHLNSIYGSFVVSPEYDFNYTISINLKSIPTDFTSLAKKISLLKFHALGAPFQKYFKAVQEGKQAKAGKVHLTPDTTIYFSPKSDRVVVIFSINFQDKRDQVVARVFLNSMVDVKRSLGTAPVVSYDMNPPNEMKQDFQVVDKIHNCGFISFGVLPRHVSSQEKIDLATGLLQSFRNYLTYHVKVSNTFFHSRMRIRVKELLQVLNRAKSEDEEASKKKKTASGRTFSKK